MGVCGWRCGDAGRHQHGQLIFRPNVLLQMYIDSIWWGQAPDGDQYIAKLLRESFEELFHRYQASRSVCNL